MADRRVRYILEVDYDGESATLKAADDLRDVDEAARQAGDGLGQAESGFSKMQASLVTAGAVLGIAEQGFAALQQAAQMAYETLSEGAALQDLHEDFDALADSVGSTADAMLNDMGTAAGGMLTSAEMIGAASDLMLLNLGLTKEEIVDLVGVAGELEWSMDAVATALNTKSTRALKELGLGIEDVKGRAAVLEAQGHSLDEAFRMAILDAGRERIELVGGASDTTAGRLVILENIVKDVQDEFARGAAEGFADTLADIGEGAESAGQGMSLISLSAGHLAGTLPQVWVDAISKVTLLDEMLLVLGISAAGVGWKMAGPMREVTQAHRDAAEMAAVYAIEQGKANGEIERVGFVGEVATVAAREYAASQEWLARATGWVADETERARSADYQRSQAMEAAAAAAEAAAEAQANWSAYTDEATARGGDYFANITQSGEAQWDLGEAIYGAADAAGAGIGPLGELGVAYGVIDEKTRAAGTAMAQQQAIVDNLAGAAATGIITWEQYGEAVERAIAVLNGAPLIDLGPREMPEMDMRGFREDFQENFEAGGSADSWVIKVDAETSAVAAAVEEAQGMLTGFTETPYESTATLNIDSVVAGVGEIQRLMAEVPEQRSVQFDFSATGLEFLDELRAAGVIH